MALTEVGPPPALDRGVARPIGYRLAWAVVVAVPVGFLAVFFAYPVVTILERGLSEASALDVWRRRSTGRIVTFTVAQAAASAALSTLVGLPAAWAVARGGLPGRRLVRALLVVPFVLPTLVVGAALQATFERFGVDGRSGFHLENTTAAILLAHMVLNVAVVVRVVGTHWALLDPRTEEAARVLGASRWAVLREVTLPRLAPAIWSAAGIVFLFCFTSFGVILTVGGPGKPTLETEIWRYATQRTDIPTATALALLQMVVVVALVALVGWAERRAAAPTTVVIRDVTVGWRHRGLALAALTPAVMLVAVPLMVLVERSLAVGDGYGFAHFRALAERSAGGLSVAPLEAVRTSIVYAVAATSIALVVGGLAAVAVTHSHPRTGRLLDVALMVPLGTSAVTLGFGILVAVDTPPLDLRSSPVIVPIAQALVGLPFVVRALVPALRSLDPRPREAAAVLGAGVWRARWEADAPVLGRTALVGAAFAFAVSLGEFGATTFLARPGAPTVPVAMFRLLGQPGESLRGQAMALGVLLAGLTAVAVLVIERLRPRDALGW